MADRSGGANRREFIGQLATAAGAVVLVPAVAACGPKENQAGGQQTSPKGEPPRRAVAADPLAVPEVKPADWDAMAFNLKRGEAGAIPQGYLMNIKAEGGDKKHLGKHLPYVPKVDAKLVPGGFLAVMFGDVSKGNVRHPNAPANPAQKYIGHWYDWIKVRGASAGAREELRNEYPSWPGKADSTQKQFAVFGGGDIKADKGKNTIYLVKLPAGVKAGDTVRLWGHCLHHGEYVDFLTV